MIKYSIPTNFLYRKYFSDNKKFLFLFWYKKQYHPMYYLLEIIDDY
jgi:hypothetical protein